MLITGAADPNVTADSVKVRNQQYSLDERRTVIFGDLPDPRGSLSVWPEHGDGSRTSTVINAENRTLDLWIQGLFARMGRVGRFLPQTPCLHGRLGEGAYDEQREAERRSLSGLHIGMTDLLSSSLCRKAGPFGTVREGAESEGRKTQ